eukprot:gnl/TRDRNA2_/TRDRNA2_43299_c0_seq1.p1 gnl/TRDRNA2_/TRDRNA2_43299_c0~~gnl/TRDRNA2_/TRDRNA2_43299_c0_seq1.p1  ORF type:complete len:592 (-),score=93.48 gnl/TRDRNA2_/TRDRNA2_43299_c0_seq1:81-1856(-)
MVKKALCCGLNYPNQKHQLYGCINDCLNWAKLLEKTFDFNEVRVLIDQNPDGSIANAPTQIPTRANILAQLGWLCSGAEPGDTLVFQFAGHGCQVRTTAHGEEVDEALVPEDFLTPDADGNPPLVYDDELHALFARLPAGSFITVILDSSHAFNMLDVPCSLDASQKPPRVVQTCTRPREVRMRNDTAWTKNSHAYARPRFIQGVNLHGKVPRQRRTPHGTGAHVGQMTLDPGVTAMCFSGSGIGETALDANIKAQQQGVMSFCLLEALQALNYSCTYETLLQKANQIAEDIREKYMPSMDQHIQLTFCPNSTPSEVVVMDGRYATVALHRLNQQAKLAERGMSGERQYPEAPRGVSTDFVPRPGGQGLGGTRPPDPSFGQHPYGGPQGFNDQHPQGMPQQAPPQQQEKQLFGQPNLFGGMANLLGGSAYPQQAQQQASQQSYMQQGAYSATTQAAAASYASPQAGTASYASQPVSGTASYASQPANYSSAGYGGSSVAAYGTSTAAYGSSAPSAYGTAAYNSTATSAYGASSTPSYSTRPPVAAQQSSQQYGAGQPAAQYQYKTQPPIPHTYASGAATASPYQQSAVRYA